MKKSELIEDIAINAMVTKKVATRVVNETFRVIIEAIRRGENVTIPDFGAFKPTTRRAGMYRATIKGKRIELPVPESKSFRLSVYPSVKKSFNQNQ